MKKTFFTILGALFIFPLSFSAFAEKLSYDGDRVSVEAYTRHTPSENFEIIIKFLLHDGWHIYGEKTDELGKPTTVEISPLKETIFSPKYSATQHFVFDEIIEYDGYAEKAFIYTSFVPEENTETKMKISWMACKDFCEEEEAVFDLNTAEFHEESQWNEILLEAEKSFEAPPKEDLSFLSIVLLSFLAGIILNFMPCIFPILSIKAIYLANNAKTADKKRYINGLLYFLGVLLSFIAIATVLYALRERGESLGWGFQLQSSWFVGFMILLFGVIFLMFLDIIRIPRGAFQKISAGNSFLTGFFAVLIASPCSGPFMGMAIGYALMQEPTLYYPIFIALAAGYALPFSLADIFPQYVAKILPKSGKWMFYLKRTLAVPVFCTIVWLIWVLYAQISPTDKTHSQWIKYNEETLNTFIEKKQPVFINFTAKWCLICLLNEKTTFETNEFAKIAENNNIILMRADWTNKDEDIFERLEKYQRSSVPTYAYHKADGSYVLLPQILTPEIIKDYLE